MFVVREAAYGTGYVFSPGMSLSNAILSGGPIKSPIGDGSVLPRAKTKAGPHAPAPATLLLVLPR